MANTNGNPNGHKAVTEIEHPLDGVVTDAPFTGGGVLLQLQTGAYEMGRKIARLSGITKPLAEDLGSTEEHARSIAQDAHRERFDPSQHTHDRMLQAEYENAVAQRSEAQECETHAAANLRDAEAKLARTPKAGDKPAPNRWLVTAFIVAITITVAPTLHDFVFHTLGDDLLAWFASSVSAGFVATMLTLAILGGRRTAWRWAGVAGGVILGIGLGALRLSSAENAGEMAFGVGLTIIEIAAVLLLEWLGAGLRMDEDHWKALKVPEDEALAARDAAQAELARWRDAIAKLSKVIAERIAYVEDRFNRNVHLPELENALVKAAVAGYHAGIAENKAHLHGVRRFA